MDDCVFCRIIDGREPGYVVYEDEETIAILDKYPINKGHILVMPKRHYRDIFEIPPNTLCRVMETVKTIATAVVKGLNADGVRLIQNNGPSAGQVVFHFHVHVIPYYGGGFSWPPPRPKGRGRFPCPAFIGFSGWVHGAAPGQHCGAFLAGHESL